MKNQLTGLLSLTTLLLVACGGGTRGETNAARIAPAPTSATTSAKAPATTESPPPGAVTPVMNRGHRVTRTIDKDPDGDGIANRRIFITEVFDEAGMLLERIREDDFEADGIVDARNVTTFGE